MNIFFVIYVNVLNLYHNMNKHISCRFCQSGEEETQEHLEVCVGCDFERRGLKMSVRSDIVKFWLRMEKKLQEKKEEEKNRDTVATVT